MQHVLMVVRWGYNSGEIFEILSAKSSGLRTWSSRGSNTPVSKLVTAAASKNLGKQSPTLLPLFRRPWFHGHNGGSVERSVSYVNLCH